MTHPLHYTSTFILSYLTPLSSSQIKSLFSQDHIAGVVLTELPVNIHTTQGWSHVDYRLCPGLKEAPFYQLSTALSWPSTLLPFLMPTLVLCYLSDITLPCPFLADDATYCT